MKCDRCGGNATCSTMSRFNTETICMDCERKEKAHPDYQRARDTEHQQVVLGNLNYPGIGLPEDL